jgi:epoxyqueuosine reductase
MTTISFEELRTEALSLGWDDVGVTVPEISAENLQDFKKWLDNGLHGELEYMENPVRRDPRELYPEAKTAIIFVTNYKQPQIQPREDAGIVASYARGRDYHHLHRKRLKKFIQWLENKSGQINIAKPFSDSSPILEKALAVQAGLGWFGKNTLLIHRRFGTFTLLSGVLTSLIIEEVKLEARLPRCGSCTKCIDACPTQAITAPYILDGKKCLSYHLIESKKPIPEDIAQKNPGYVFGCDICQNVCPHNVRSPLSVINEFKPESGIGEYLNIEKLLTLEAEPERLFGTPLQRRKVPGLKHNLEVFSKKQ